MSGNAPENVRCELSTLTSYESCREKTTIFSKTNEQLFVLCSIVSKQSDIMEIERKFLLTGDFRTDVRKSMRISQGYLCSVPERTVRIRIRDDQGFITIKGKGDADGISRFEWEKEIPVNDALQLLQICEPGVIDKTRHLVDFGGHTFEVDEFHGDNEGLVMAEIELTSPDEPFDKPSWLGKEVTGDARYYNSALSRNPYKNW